MSGVYIPGMEMPTSCDMCWALDEYGDYPRCRITEEQRGYNFPVREQRMSHCPLVPVPDHGRLIDADAIEDDVLQLKQAAITAWKWTGCGNEWNERINERNRFAVMIEDAPAIIPADREEGDE